jgi:serine-type D-Ala-D-Ala carboxypeptidase (penicillin-binding protein 5/6)
MSTKTTLLLISVLVFLLSCCSASTAAALKSMARSPYLGAIVIDAATGKVLFERYADTRGYPASVTKLMVLLVVLEAVDSHRLKLDDKVTVTKEAAKIGGSQVYLKENEVFSVDDLLYALIVQSANDAAVALAIHYAGSKEAFVKLMNARAQQLGMRYTVFHSVHGLPPGRGQLPDVSTARDIAILCRQIVKKPKALKYTSTKEHILRAKEGKPFIMRSHNPLLTRVPGCDGLKTGFFNAAGWSIAATATKDNRRAIAVVLGATDRRIRDKKAKMILSDGLLQLALNPSPPPAAPPATPPAAGVVQIKASALKTVGAGLGGLVLLGVVLFAVKRRTRPSAYLR